MGDKLNASGGREAAVTARTRIEWIKFEECGKLLNGRKLLWKMKEQIHWSCVRLAMLLLGVRHGVCKRTKMQF